METRSMRRHRVPAIIGILITACLSQGCRTGTERDIPPPVYEDDFGVEDPAEITVASVQREEELFQRAQVELRLGPSFPFDIFRPDVESDSDAGLMIGLKGSWEIDKNLFLSATADWTRINVDDPERPVPPGSNQILALSHYNKFNLLFGLDYDIPIYFDEATNPLIFRAGLGAGVNIDKLSEFPGNVNTFETFIAFVLRPSVGLRYEILDGILGFTELSYDWVPERSLQTNESGKLTGERAVFSSGAILFGLAFEFD